MEVLPYIGLFVGALFFLVKSSDWFVEAAEDIGLGLGISPYIIGVTIVAFGTSLPELAANVAAVLGNTSELVLANVVGSNIANVLLVLGLTAVVAKNIVLESNIMDIDMPLLLGSAGLLYFVLADGQIGTFECVILLIALAIFLLSSLKGEKEILEEKHITERKSYIILPIAIILVSVSAYYTIESIKEISLAFNIPEEIIGLTLVALGTSLPEVAVSIAAARKGKSAIAVGNVVGSNIFNTLAVVGIPGLLGTIVLPPDVMQFGMPFMIAITILFAFMCMSRRITKWEGSLLLIMYCFYIYQIVI